jgi:hypothetical protein
VHFPAIEAVKPPTRFALRHQSGSRAKDSRAFTYEALAAGMHCSSAMICRHTGGEAAMREDVTTRSSSRIVGLVREVIKGSQGTERVVTAIVVALGHIWAGLIGDLNDGVGPAGPRKHLVDSARVPRLAQEVIGYDDPLAAQWLLRVTLALCTGQPRTAKSSTRLQDASLVHRLLAKQPHRWLSAFAYSVGPAASVPVVSWPSQGKRKS